MVLAADQLSEQELLGTRSALLALISDRVWERLLAHVKKSWPTARVVRVEHAARVARAQRALGQQRARRTDAAVNRIGRSEQGALGSLVTDGIDLYSTANQQLVRITLSDGKFVSVSDLPGAEVDLSCCGPSLLFTCASTGTVGRMLIGEFRHEVLASNRYRPHMPFHCGWRPYWIERDQRSPMFTVLIGMAKRRDAWNEMQLAWLSMLSSSAAGIEGDDDFIFVLDQFEAGKTQLKWLRHDGMHFESVAPTEHVEPGPGRPLLAHSSEELLWPANNKILAARKLRLESTVRATASGPIAAIIPTENGLYTLTGRPQDRTWHVEFAAAGQGMTERIGSFDRRGSDRVTAVALAETLYFVCGQDLYCAWSRLHPCAEER